MSAVKLLDLSHHADIIGSDEVDGNTLSAESTTTTDTVNVVLAVGRKIVVDDQRDLLNINTTSQQVSGNQNTRRTRAELLHDHITLSLLHVAVHGRDSEVASGEFVGEPVDLSSGVAEDDGLSDGDGFVEIRECIQLPFFLLDSDVELLDTFEGQFSLLDQDTDRVAHEFRGDFEDVLWHGGGKKDHLGGLWEKLEDVVNLLGETARQHLISLVQDEHLHVVGLEHTSLDHVLDSAWGSDDDLRTVLKCLHVFPNVCTADASMAFDIHEIADSHNHLLDLLSKLTSGSKDESLAGFEVGINLLKAGDGEGGSLASAGLSLRNDIGALDDGHDSTLLDG